MADALEEWAQWLWHTQNTHLGLQTLPQAVDLLEPPASVIGPTTQLTQACLDYCLDLGASSTARSGSLIASHDGHLRGSCGQGSNYGS